MEKYMGWDIVDKLHSTFLEVLAIVLRMGWHLSMICPATSQPRTKWLCQEVTPMISRCQSHLELVLRLLNSSLPSDVRLRLVRDTEEWQHRTLLQSLDAIRQEAADRAKRLENTLEEQTEISEGQTVTITAATKGDLKVAALTDTKIKALSE